MTDFLPFLEGQYQKRVYARSDSVNSTWTSVVTDSVPGGKKGIIVALAGDNTAGVDLDIYINGKSASDYGFIIECDGLPSNLEAIEPMVVLPEGAKYEIRLRRLAGSGTFKWRMEVIFVPAR